MAPRLSKQQKISVSLLALSMADKPRKKRTVWAKRLYLERPKYSHLRSLEILDTDDFRNVLRMTPDVFFELLAMVRPHIKKNNTVMREAVSAEERLICTLLFLASGRSYADLKFTAAVSKSSMSAIIPETCEAIYNCLKSGIKIPSTQEEWNKVAEGFETKWNFPHCLGAVDGKHIAINKPPDSGSLYFNYKKFFSVILLAVVDADYRFMYVNVGTNGSASDSTVWESTKLFEKLMEGSLHLPPPTNLPGTNINAPHVLLGDCGSSINMHFLKPFSLKNIDKRKRIFNHRLSRARRVVENAFGILTSRFRVFRQNIAVSLQHVDAIILACCALHNYLSTKSSVYLDGSTCANGSTQDSGLVALCLENAKRRNEQGNEVRETFVNYFMTEGSIPFQEDKIDVDITK